MHYFLNIVYSWQNEILWFILIIANFSLVLLAFRFWGKLGLFIFAALSTVLANIQVLKQVNLFMLPTSMGDINYIGIYLISDILCENYGKHMARKVIGIGVFSVIATALVMYLSLIMQPNMYDHAQRSLDTIFGFFPRIIIASITAFGISQMFDIMLYQFWRNKFPAYKYIWIRNNFSTLFSQTLDIMIFNLIAFTGIFPFNYILKIFFTSWLLRTVISILDTPFVYYSVKIKQKVREV